MNLLSKMALVPFISFFVMMISVALLGKEGIKAMPWLFPDNNALYVYVGWVVLLSVIVSIQHYTKRRNDND